MKLTLQSIVAFVFLSMGAYAQSVVHGEISVFAAQTGADITTDKATGELSFVRFPAGKAFKQAGNSSNEKALNFMNQHSKLFSIGPNRDIYQVKNKIKDNYGMEHVALQQYVNGVPVFDGVVKFHFNKNKEVLALNGNIVKADKLNVVPSITQEDAAAVALKMVESQKGESSTPLTVHQNTLYVFQKGLAQGYAGQKHLVYEVEVRNGGNVREFLYIDAHTKELVEQFTGTHEVGLNRRLYNSTYVAANPATNLAWKEGDPFPGSLNIWQQSEIETAGQMYYLIKNAFGYSSYDNHDATMITTHNNPNIACPNANWNGETANYCDKIAADDVVAHEWGHAYTEYTSGLIYSWQAGALNEAYSDIWGETVDLINNYFDAGEGTAMRDANGTDNPIPSVTTRWRVGEKASAFGTPDGALRDMYNPNNFGNPGKVTDAKYYCAYKALTNSNDFGGVHINSGVINHSYALLVDGGTYNGQTINGIGLTKAAHIYWYAQANFMTKTTDFAAQADILEAATQALIDANTNLTNLSTANTAPTLSGQIVTAADLSELKKVLLAVELRSETNCGYVPLLQPVAEICVGGTPANAFFFADFESGLGSWTVQNTSTSATWQPHNWVINSSAPGNRAGNVIYAVDPDGDNCQVSDQSGVISLISPVVTIPTGSSGPFMLAFDQYISIEGGWDGGILMYKANGGVWTQVPLSAFTANGYNATVITTANGNTNPLQGRQAFSGADQGTFSGSWGQSRVNLSALAGIAAGATVQLKWDMGSDACFGLEGWYLDDIRIYSCANPTVQFITENTTANEAESTTPNSTTDCLSYIEKTVTVKINKAPSAPVTVTFNAPTGSATFGAKVDYSFTPNSFVLQAGTLTQNVVVRIYNDAYVEGTETAELTYTLATIGDATPESTFQKHTIIIHDNEIIPGVETVEVLYADFNNNALPIDWISTDSDGDGLNAEYPGDWAVRDDVGTVLLDPVASGRPLLIANSDAFGKGLKTWRVETAPFSTAGMTTINLSFLEYFRIYNVAGDFAEVATIEVWNGTVWNTIFTQTEANGRSGAWGAPATRNIVIPDIYAHAAMKLRFNYTANYDYWWALDNIKVTAKPTPTQTESAVSAAPDEQYLGPKATAYFYDPTTGNLLAMIENLTDHDYGCTQVEIDRAGAGSEQWVRDYTITKKTYKVTPANPNPAGEYNITLYYKDADLGAYKSSITSMGKSEGSITTNNTGTTSFAEVQVSAAFNTDYAYKAKFNSGFSGFGLSDAPPVGSLPVKLMKFDGSYGVEGNMLKWETAAELNSAYFAVERASDAKHFTEIRKVLASKTSSISNRYHFTDSKYSLGLNYYRLRMVDQDGSRAYSNIVAIDALNLRKLKYFPNPVHTILNIELPDVTLNEVNMKIINISGQVVMEKGKVETVNGALIQDVSRLGTGLYQVVISDGKSAYNFSVVKL